MFSFGVNNIIEKKGLTFMKWKIALIFLIVLTIYIFWFLQNTKIETPPTINKTIPTVSVVNHDLKLQLMQNYIAAHPLNGALLVAVDDQILLSEAYGIKNKEKELNNTIDTEFLIGSMTKFFTAAAILKLEEEGKIDLSSPISTYLNEKHAVWGSNFPSFAHDITIQQLLSHSSGLEDKSKLPGFVKFNLDVHEQEEVIQFFSDYPLKFLPGSQYDYSGSGYTLLGVIIEEVTGEKYESYLKKVFFEPLQMTSTAILPFRFLGSILEQYPNLSIGYMEDDRKRNLSEVEDVNLSSFFAEGTAISTTNDLFLWLRALFRGDILNPEGVKKMTTPYFETRTKHLFTGFGVYVNTEKNRPIQIISSGAIGGYEGILSYEPRSKSLIIILSNVMNDKTGVMARDLMNILQTKEK
jgi:CubicO group peptidase (beta-lactamase class C family)